MSDIRRSYCLAAIAVVALVVMAAGAAAQTQDGSPRFAGRSLKAALGELQSMGLRIVFTSEVVRPEMTVETEPMATEPRQILEELLAPYGLEARDGPRGTVVVARRIAAPDAPAAIGGIVRSRLDSGPIAGALVQLIEADLEVTTGADGRFAFIAPAPGDFTLQAGRSGFTVERVAVTVAAGSDLEVSVRLDSAPALGEELVITPSRVSLMREEPVPLMQLSRQEILALPHLSDDFYRALTLLPGATSNDVTAEFHVRGARRDETQVLLDGQELYEAYHLKDFDNALSFVASSNLASADLTTGGFPAEYGDRMAGVLDMTTIRPSGANRFRVGAGILSAHLAGFGTFQDERGAWLAEVRRGTIDLASRLLGKEDPSYWDAYGKLDYQLSARNSLRASLLASGDELTFSEVEDEASKRTDTRYDSTYAWLTHQALLRDNLFVDTAVSTTEIERDRAGLEFDEDAEFEIHDLRESEILGLRQSWNLQAGDKNMLRGGFELRSFDTTYDYQGTRIFEGGIGDIRPDSDVEEILFLERFDERHDAIYLTDRIQIVAPLTLELGLRYDRYTRTDDSQVTPRVNLAWAPSDRTVIRAAWGDFHQSQRSYELQVEDGETAFHPVEEAEHFVVGFERSFETAPGKGLALRAEVYRREVVNPRPRYENLYEALNTFPEVEPDRVRIAPDEAVAEGIELFLRGRSGPRLGWFVNYTYATSEDLIDGIWTPRQFDQRHTVNVDFDFLAGKHWHLNVAWRFHTGWPTTPLDLTIEEDDEGEIEFVPELGQLYSQRLPEYHRLDLRASREWRVRSGVLGFYVDIQNVYNRKNLAGFDIQIDDEEGALIFETEYWAKFLPSAGVTFEF